MLFDFISTRSWAIFSNNVTSFDLPKAFDLLLATKVSEDREHEDHRLNKIYALNNLLQPMSSAKAMEAWNRMEGLHDSFTLMTIVLKSPDFSTAYGIVEGFLSEKGNAGMRLDDKFANSLLDRATAIAEIDACRSLFLSLGLITKAGIDEAKTLGIPAVSMTGDEITHGILINKQFIPVETIQKMLRHFKSEEKVRSNKTLGALIYRADSFSDAYRILFGEPDYITKAEQKQMQSSPLIISHLIRKTAKEQDIRIVNNLIEDMIDNLQDDIVNREGILHKDFNIITEYINNDRLTPTHSEALAFIDRIEARTGFPISSEYVERALLRSLWVKQYHASRKDKIEKTNNRIIERCSSPRSHLRKLILIRYNEGRTVSNVMNNPPALDDIEEFPFITDDTHCWEIQTCSRFNFLMNMMKHRFLHPSCAYLAIMRLAYDARKKPKEADGIKKRCIEILNLAECTSLHFDYDSFVRLRNTVSSNFKDNRLTDALRRIVTDYSVMKDVCYNLHNEKNSIAEAEATLNKYEKENKIKLYRNTAYYDALINRLKRDKNSTVDSILEYRSRTFPKDIPWTDNQKSSLLHKVTTKTELEKLLSIFDLPENWPDAIRKSFKDKVRNTSESPEALIDYILGIDANGNLLTPKYDIHAYPTFVTIAIYSYKRRLNFDMLYRFISVNGLDPDEWTYPYLGAKVKNVEQLLRMTSMAGFQWTSSLADSILRNLDTNRYFKPGNNEELVDYISKNLLDTFIMLYKAEKKEKRKYQEKNFSIDCERIYRENIHLSPKDKANRAKSALAELCWKIKSAE